MVLNVRENVRIDFWSYVSYWISWWGSLKKKYMFFVVQGSWWPETQEESPSDIGHAVFRCPDRERQKHIRTFVGSRFQGGWTRTKARKKLFSHPLSVQCFNIQKSGIPAFSRNTQALTFSPICAQCSTNQGWSIRMIREPSYYRDCMCKTPWFQVLSLPNLSIRKQIPLSNNKITTPPAFQQDMEIIYISILDNYCKNENRSLINCEASGLISINLQVVSERYLELAVLMLAGWRYVMICLNNGW